MMVLFLGLVVGLCLFCVMSVTFPLQSLILLRNIPSVAQLLLLLFSILRYSQSFSLSMKGEPIVLRMRSCCCRDPVRLLLVLSVRQAGQSEERQGEWPCCEFTLACVRRKLCSAAWILINRALSDLVLAAFLYECCLPKCRRRSNLGISQCLQVFLADLAGSETMVFALEDSLGCMRCCQRWARYDLQSCAMYLLRRICALRFPSFCRCCPSPICSISSSPASLSIFRIRLVSSLQCLSRCLWSTMWLYSRTFSSISAMMGLLPFSSSLPSAPFLAASSVNLASNRPFSMPLSSSSIWSMRDVLGMSLVSRSVLMLATTGTLSSLAFLIRVSRPVLLIPYPQ